MIGCSLRDHSNGEVRRLRTFPEPVGMGLVIEAEALALKDLWVLLTLGRRGFNHYYGTDLRGE